jgi:hypothetical protein
MKSDVLIYVAELWCSHICGLLPNNKKFSITVGKPFSHGEQVTSGGATVVRRSFATVVVGAAGANGLCNT